MLWDLNNDETGEVVVRWWGCKVKGKTGETHVLSEDEEDEAMARRVAALVKPEPTAAELSLVGATFADVDDPQSATDPLRIYAVRAALLAPTGGAADADADADAEVGRYVIVAHCHYQTSVAPDQSSDSDIFYPVAELAMDPAITWREGFVPPAADIAAAAAAAAAVQARPALTAADSLSPQTSVESTSSSEGEAQANGEGGSEGEVEAVPVYALDYDPFLPEYPDRAEAKVRPTTSPTTFDRRPSPVARRPSPSTYCSPSTSDLTAKQTRPSYLALRPRSASPATTSSMTWAKMGSSRGGSKVSGWGV